MAATSRSLSDSFDFSNLPGGVVGRRGSKWLEKVNKLESTESETVSPLIGSRHRTSPPPPPPPPPPVPMPPAAPVPRAVVPKAASPVKAQTTAGRSYASTAAGRMATPHSQQQRLPASSHGSARRDRSRTLSPQQSSGVRSVGRSPHTPSYNYGRDALGGVTTSSMFTSPRDYTPTATHCPPDLTAVGSPIPMETDDSDLAMGALVSQLQRATAGYGGYAHPVHHPHHSNDGGRLSPQSPRDDTPRSSPPLPAPPPCPFGNESSAMTAQPGAATPSSAYTSALIQALSMSEGAAMASANQNSLTSVPAYHRTRRRAQHGSDSSDSYDYSDEEYEGDNGYGDVDEDEDGSPVDMDRGNDLYDHAMRVMIAKQQWISLEKARQEILENARLERDCPFQPKVSPYAAKIERPAQLRPENRAHGEMLRKKQWVAMKRREEAEKDLEGCTFRPITLRTARLEKDGRPRTDSQVFSELYHEAEARQRFEKEVQPQIVGVMERHVLHPGTSGPVLPKEEVERVVERLFSKGAVVVQPSGAVGKGSTADGPNAAAVTVTIPEETFKPALSKETVKMMAEKRRCGERDPDVIHDLYDRNEMALLERQLAQALEAEQQRQARQALLAQREEAREKLEVERLRAVLGAKYVALARHAFEAGGHQERKAFKPKGPHSVVALARAALDVLSPDETEELLAAFEHCGVDKVTEKEFVFLAQRHVMKKAKRTPADEAAAPAQEESDWRKNPLFALPPPAPTRARSISTTTPARRPSIAYNDPLSLPAPPLPRVKREKADPALLEQVRRKREEQMLAWREEARHRAEEKEMGDPDYKPLPRRLIPYECRPDVHVPIRTNRAAKLRETHTKESYGGAEKENAVFEDARAAGATASTALEVRQTVNHVTQPSRAKSEDAATARALFPRAAGASPAKTRPTRRLSQAAPVVRGRAGSRGGYAENAGPGALATTSPAGRAGTLSQPVAQTQATRRTQSAKVPAVGGRPARRGASEQPAEGLAIGGGTSSPSPAPTAPTPIPPPAPARHHQVTAAPEMATSPSRHVTPSPANQTVDHAEKPITAGKDRLYSGVIAEHAAFGGEEALMELGRQLLLRQLQEYQKKHKQTTA